jgi:hypothetical protein
MTLSMSLPSISRQTNSICSRDSLTTPCDDARMDDRDALEQLRADIFDAFAPGLKRDVWLAWLDELANDSIWREAARNRKFH